MTNTQNDSLKQAVKRFCRTDEAADNLVKFIEQYGYEQRIDENRRWAESLKNSEAHLIGVPHAPLGVSDYELNDRIESLERLKKGEET